MIDFMFTTVWGWIIIAHLIGMIYFQPKFVRSYARRTRLQCKHNNSKSFCEKYHDFDCKFENTPDVNLDGEDIAWGTIYAAFWEIAAVVQFFIKRAAAPDKLAKQLAKQKDETSLEILTNTQQTILEYDQAMQVKAIEAGESSADAAEEVKPRELREVFKLLNMERQRQANWTPVWDSDKQDYVRKYEAPVWMDASVD